MANPTDATELTRAVRRALADAGDPEIAAGQARYMKSSMPYRGVRAPAQRSLMRSLIDAYPLATRADWETAIRSLWDDAEYREERYAATTIAGHRRYRSHQDPVTLSLYDHLVVTGAWWDHVDDIASHLVGPILRDHREEATPIVRAWSTDDDRWRRRTSIIAQLGAKSATDTDLLADAIDVNLDDGDFFIRKAIGWALREYAKTDEAWVRSFLRTRSDRLSPLSRREAAKHLA